MQLIARNISDHNAFDFGASMLVGGMFWLLCGLAGHNCYHKVL